VSPIVGFVLAALLLLLCKVLIKNKALYEAPEKDQPPPWWIRLLLIGTCTGVSYAHGSNDGQKGMGLIMLILIGILPITFAVDLTTPQHRLGSWLPRRKRFRSKWTGTRRAWRCGNRK